MSALGRLRAAWPLLFIAPLWLVLDRLCWSQPTHALLHATMTLHAWLPQIIVVAAVVSLAVIARKLERVSGNLRTLCALASPMPQALRRALAIEAASFGLAEPRTVYLDVETPICYTVVPGPSILVSRGFIEELGDDDLGHVVRHELVHVARRDPLRGLLWHLFFSALLVPGFGGLERWFYDRRERRTNEIAGMMDRERYAALATRVRGAESAFERSLGHAYAGAFAPCATPRAPGVFVRPVIALTSFVALLGSHAVFLDALPFLERHHC